MFWISLQYELGKLAEVLGKDLRGDLYSSASLPNVYMVSNVIGSILYGEESKGDLAEMENN